MGFTHIMFVAAFLWGLHGIPIALSDAPPNCVAIWRFGGSFIILAAVALITTKSKSELFNIEKNFIFSALFWALNNYLFIWAVAMDGGSVSRTVALSYSFPIFTIVLSYFKARDITPQDLVCVLFVSLGISAFAFDLGSAQLLSATLALLSGLTLALHFEFATELKSFSRTITSVSYGQLIGFLLCFSTISHTEFATHMGAMTISSGLWIVALIVLTAVTFLLYGVAAHRLPTKLTASILLLEIVVATVSGALLLSEKLEPFTLIGTALLLTALFVRIFGDEIAEQLRSYLSTPATLARVRSKKFTYNLNNLNIHNMSSACRS